MSEKLTPSARRQALQKLSGWKKQHGRDAITKTFLFADFKTAFAWMTQIALQAEDMQHHPEWQNVYNRVHVVLTTHDAGGITARDIKLAGYMDKAAQKIGKRKPSK